MIFLNTIDDIANAKIGWTTYFIKNLSLLQGLIKEVNPDARRRNTHFNFRVIYPDLRYGRYCHTELGSTVAGSKGVDDAKTLSECKFTIGDYLDVSISPPGMRGDRMDYGRRGGMNDRFRGGRGGGGRDFGAGGGRDFGRGGDRSDFGRGGDRRDIDTRDRDADRNDRRGGGGLDRRGGDERRGGDDKRDRGDRGGRDRRERSRSPRDKSRDRSV